MPRKNSNAVQIPPISLNLKKADHARLWEQYQKKTEMGEGAEWIRQTLIASLPGYLTKPKAAERPADVTYEDVES